LLLDLRGAFWSPNATLPIAHCGCGSAALWNLWFILIFGIWV
jgi:hypothetical protein